MWFLEHDILFGGKRIWLKPGTQHLFGRTSSKGGEASKHIAINHKSVSRQHMVLKVLPVVAGDGTKLQARSRVEITDLSCRQGITIDGQKNVVSTKEGGDITTYGQLLLDGTAHTIKLSSYSEFRLKWKPVVLTLATREHKAHVAQLHQYDIKSTSDFVYNQTTHVVSQKRNLPKVLQGLVAGVYIVTGNFIDAILTATEPRDSSQDNFQPSRLEEDFDTWWPEEKEFIPPVGIEPIPRPGEMLEPDSRRSEVFSGLTVIFMSESQYNTLQDPITGGGGKAIFYNLQYGKTTVDEYVQFVRNTAGEKRRGRISGENLPIITVRLANPPDNMEEWAADFVSGVDQALNQRSVPQNEFLDAIIMKDASSLQQSPPRPADVPSTTVSMTVEEQTPVTVHEQRQIVPLQDSHSESIEEAQQAIKEEPLRATGRKRPMRRAQSRFTGFDDYEPPPKIRKVQDDAVMEDVSENPPIQSSLDKSQATNDGETRNHGRDVSNVDELADEPLNHDELFPAAAKVRQMRATTRGASASVSPDTATTTAVPKTKRGATALARLEEQKKKHEKEINIREEARLRLQEEEQKIKEDEEYLRQMLDGVDISALRDLVQVEPMELRQQHDRPQKHRAAAVSNRWREEWNGRKNFKNFRRHGAERGPQTQKVIVALEEAPQKKGFGLGDPLFLEEPEPARTKADERRLNRRLGRGYDSNAEPEPGFARSKRTNQPHDVIHLESSDLDDEEEVLEDTIAQGSEVQRVTQTQRSHPESQIQKSASKRPLPVLTGPIQPSAKRTRVTRTHEDSDNEETGFRLKKKRRWKRGAFSR